MSKISWTDEEDLDNEDWDCLPHSGNVFIDTRYKRRSTWSLGSTASGNVHKVYNISIHTSRPLVTCVTPWSCITGIPTGHAFHAFHTQKLFFCSVNSDFRTFDHTHYVMIINTHI